MLYSIIPIGSNLGSRRRLSRDRLHPLTPQDPAGGAGGGPAARTAHAAAAAPAGSTTRRRRFRFERHGHRVLARFFADEFGGVFQTEKWI